MLFSKVFTVALTLSMVTASMALAAGYEVREAGKDAVEAKSNEKAAKGILEGKGSNGQGAKAESTKTDEASGRAGAVKSGVNSSGISAKNVKAMEALDLGESLTSKTGKVTPKVQVADPVKADAAKASELAIELKGDVTSALNLDGVNSEFKRNMNSNAAIEKGIKILRIVNGDASLKSKLTRLKRALSPESQKVFETEARKVADAVSRAVSDAAAYHMEAQIRNEILDDIYNTYFADLPAPAKGVNAAEYYKAADNVAKIWLGATAFIEKSVARGLKAPTIKEALYQSTRKLIDMNHGEQTRGTEAFMEEAEREKLAKDIVFEKGCPG